MIGPAVVLLARKFTGNDRPKVWPVSGVGFSDTPGGEQFPNFRELTINKKFWAWSAKVSAGVGPVGKTEGKPATARRRAEFQG